MQKITLFFFVVFSQIVFSNTKITETEKLAAACKVWGFLKYYHPKAASGEVNWDKQLLDILPKINKTQTKEEFSLVLEHWIDDLGPIKEIAPIPVPKDVEYFDKNFDLSWFNNRLFSKKLSKKLKFIEENRFQGEQFYIYGVENVGNVGLRNENLKHPDFTDKNSKLRMVFIFWNLVEYFFPDKYLMDQKWDTTLEMIIPLAIEAQNYDDFYLVMQKLVSRIDDSHTDFYPYSSSSAVRKQKLFFPALGKIIDEKIVVTEILGDSLAEADDIKVGTIITKINDKTIKEIISENRELICASNEPKYLDKLVEMLLSGYSETVKVEFLKEDKYTTKTMTWFDYHDSHRNEFKKGARKKKEKFKLLDNNIGYVDMGIIKVSHIPDMVEALKNTKAIVFDMRNYPNGTFEEISKFINPHKQEFAMYTHPDLTYPGRYNWSSEITTSGFENNDYYKGKVIVLLNEKTQSQAEWTAMCFQTSGRTTIIGSQTSGADGNVSIFDFEGFNTCFSGIGVFYPDRRETQRIGIVPDIEVKPTIKGIQEGRDEVLDRALAFIETSK